MASLSSGIGVDDVYVGFSSPQAVLGSGSAASQIGMPGMACWGPKHVPVYASNPQSLTGAFGPPINSGRDIVQNGVVAMAQSNGATTVVGVRETDTTDTAATATVVDTAAIAGAIFTGLYTGTLGNQIKVSVVPGTNSGVALTYKVTVQCAQFRTEVWDRIPGPTGTVAWQNIVSAVNSGFGNSPKSNFVVASLPGTPSALFPATAGQTVTLSGGTNGGLITSSMQLGVDGTSGSRTGVYALRGVTMRAVVLAGNTDSTTWPTLDAFAVSENTLAGHNLPPSTNPVNAVAAVVAAGVNSANSYIACGTATYLDTFLGVQVTIPQSAVIAGVIASLQTYMSPGNTVVRGILGTEQTMGPNPQPYSFADMTMMESNGIIFITSPIPGANALGVRHGKNSSTNFPTSEIAYSTKTNDFAKAFQTTVMGQFVNKMQSTSPTDPLRLSVNAAFNAYLGPMVGFSINSYNVVCDNTNNTPQTIASGQLIASVIITYLAVVNQFIINVTAGQTVVTVNTTTTVTV